MSNPNADMTSAIAAMLKPLLESALSMSQGDHMLASVALKAAAHVCELEIQRKIGLATFQAHLANMGTVGGPQ